MANLVKIDTTSTTLGDVIADIDTPLVITDPLVGGVTVDITHPTYATLRVNWSPNVADAAEAEALVHTTFNAAFEAGIADPYAVPVVSEVVVVNAGHINESGNPHPFSNYVLAP